MAKREDKMAWHFNKLAEASHASAEAIEYTLGVGFYFDGKEWIDEDGLAFTIQQCGERVLGVKFTLVISGADIEKAFYIGKPEPV